MSDTSDRGRTIGKYEVVARLSVGGMAELFLASAAGPGGFRKFVALKQMLPEVREDPSYVQMFLDEARVTAMLVHPNVGQVFDLGIDPDRGDPYFAMEFIAGENLARVKRTLLKAGRPWPVPIAARIVHDVCLGLHAAHALTDASGRSLGIVHRDVTPRNVMVSYTGQVKVIDFGIAHARDTERLTAPGQLRGTLTYITPEQVLGLPLDARTDVFAAGTLLYELLTNRAMHPDETEAPRAVVNVWPLAPSTLNPAVSPALDAAVLKALEKAPGHRHQTARLFARAVADAVRLADEEDVSGVMESLFADRRRITQQLLETPADDARSAATISTFLKDLREPSSGQHDLGAPAKVVLSAAPPQHLEQEVEEVTIVHRVSRAAPERPVTAQPAPVSKATLDGLPIVPGSLEEAPALEVIAKPGIPSASDPWPSAPVTFAPPPPSRSASAWPPVDPSAPPSRSESAPPPAAPSAPRPSRSESAPPPSAPPGPVTRAASAAEASKEFAAMPAVTESRPERAPRGEKPEREARPPRQDAPPEFEPRPPRPPLTRSEKVRWVIAVVLSLLAAAVVGTFIQRESARPRPGALPDAGVESAPVAPK